MIDPIYSLFQDCTVCIQSPGERGTGFFVSPGKVLSCAHVVKLTSPSEISVHWQGQVVHPIRVLLAPEWETIAHHDLVLLEVPMKYHPCVYLDEAVSPGDRLYSYGYPDALEKRQGDSLTPECSGTSDNNRMLTLRDENIRGGFSGAPLLNQRSFKVCGVIKSDRSVQLEHLRRFGGRGIPISQVYAQWPDLAEQNRAWEHLTFAERLES